MSSSTYYCPRCLRVIHNGYPGSRCWCLKVTWTRMRHGTPPRHAPISPDPK